MGESYFQGSIYFHFIFVKKCRIKILLHRLDVKLKWPFRRIIAVAEFDFNPAENNQLPLKKGCQVTVLSKEGDYKGWWKGEIQDRVSNYREFYLSFDFCPKVDGLVLVWHLPCIC
jgi:guanine nucleotide exchange factor VAV